MDEVNRPTITNTDYHLANDIETLFSCPCSTSESVFDLVSMSPSLPDPRESGINPSRLGAVTSQKHSNKESISKLFRRLTLWNRRSTSHAHSLPNKDCQYKRKITEEPFPQVSIIHFNLALT